MILRKKTENPPTNKYTSVSLCGKNAENIKKKDIIFETVKLFGEN
jgi:hypothetical protein